MPALCRRPPSSFQAAGDDGHEAGVADDADALDALRQRNVDEDVLTELGRERGYVGFQSCPLYGRVVGEIIYTLNDAVRRMQDRTSFYVMGGDVPYVERVQRYYRVLGTTMQVLRRELAAATAFCRQEVG